MSNQDGNMFDSSKATKGQCLVVLERPKRGQELHLAVSYEAAREWAEEQLAGHPNRVATVYALTDEESTLHRIARDGLLWGQRGALAKRDHIPMNESLAVIGRMEEALRLIATVNEVHDINTARLIALRALEDDVVPANAVMDEETA